MNTTRLITGIVFLIAIIGMTAFLLWPSMPTMSDRGNEAATALLSATNRKDEQAILAVETKVKSWVVEGVLPESDAEILTSIIDLAKAKNWDRSSAKARRLKKAQIVEQP